MSQEDTATGADRDPDFEAEWAASLDRMRGYNRRRDVLSAINEERERQIAKWGPQSHPDGTGSCSPVTFEASAGDSYATMEDRARESCEEATKFGDLTWLDILLEEVYEAAAAEAPVALRKELVQVAAVATAWIEDIDARG